MTTKHIEQYSFSDGQIEKIYIDSEGLKIQYKKWDENRIELIFSEYRGLQDYGAIGLDIEDIRVSNETDILHKIKELILNSGGSEEEYVNLQQISFISSWGDESLLDIIAEHMSIKEL